MRTPTPILANALEILAKAKLVDIDQSVACDFISEAAGRLRAQSETEENLRGIIRKIECICGEALCRNVLKEDTTVIQLVQELAEHASRP